MRDTYGRTIEYLRLSVTGQCNQRCIYCVGEGEEPKTFCNSVLSVDEMIMAVKAAVSCGVKKVRITGGEPLVHPDIIAICNAISRLPGIDEVCLTTNGTRLREYAADLKNAGVKRINISLDTLDEKKYAAVTRGGNLKDALDGLSKALLAGFDKVKVNAVLLSGFSEDEIVNLAKLTLTYPVDVRFIEQMPMCRGETGKEASFLPGEAVIQAFQKENLQFEPAKRTDGSSLSLSYRLWGALGNVGIIAPLSHKFCAECNRIRLTADGAIKPCLHHADEYRIKGKTYREMEEIFRLAIQNKPREHQLTAANRVTGAGRCMREIGG